MNLNCDAFYKLLVVLAVVLVIKFIYDNMNKSEAYCSFDRILYQSGTGLAANQTPENLIGMVYPPKAGPLHTNQQFPEKADGCPSPFVAIYDQQPFLRYFNKSPRVC